MATNTATNKATIKREETKATLLLEAGSSTIQIVLTEDNPNNVKMAFNGLLKELKKGLIEFKLEDTAEDLYHHICKEYITQLNAELKSVYAELSELELLESK